MVQKDGRGGIKTSWMGDSAASNQQKSDASVDASERTEGASSVFFFSARLPTKIALFGYSEQGGGGGAAPGRGKDHPEGRQGSRQRRRKREQKGRVKICICLSIKTSDSSAAEFSMMPERR